MKKSTKLLSVILAIVMIFSTMSVMAFAAKTEYQSSDNLTALGAYDPDGAVTRLTTEARMSIVFDYLDNILAVANINMGQIVSISDIKITIDLRSINAVCSSIDTVKSSLSSSMFGFASAFVNLGILENGVTMKSWEAGMTRENRDQLYIVQKLLAVVKDNSSVISGVISSGNLDLGIVANFVDLTSVNKVIADIPGLIKGLIFPMFNRADDSLELCASRITNAAGDGKVEDTLDEVIINAVTKPQSFVSYKTDATGKCINNIVLPTASGTRNYYTLSEDGTYYTCKYYDTDSTSKTYKGYADLLDAETNIVKYVKTAERDSTGAVIDYVWQTADGDNLKYYVTDSYWLPTLKAAIDKGLDISLKTHSAAQILYTAIPYLFSDLATTVLNGSVKKLLAEWFGASFTYVGEVGDAEVKALSDYSSSTIFTKAQGTYALGWSDYEIVNNTPYYRYLDGIYKGDISGVNPYYSIINWSYTIPSNFIDEFVPTAGTDGTTATVTASTAGYNTLLQATNAFFYKAFQTVLSTDTLSKINWTNGNNTNLVANARKAVQTLAAISPEYIFGTGYDAGYYNLVADSASTNQEILLGIVASILKAAMPQIILPSAANLKGQSVLSLVAVMVRELATQFVPGYDYDALIYSNYNTKTLVAGKDNSYWLDVCITMGVDIGMSYLSKLADTGSDDTTNGFAFASTKTYDLATFTANPQAWENTVDWIIDWGLSNTQLWSWKFEDFFATGTANTLSADEDPWVKLNAIITDILPVGDIFNAAAASGKTWLETVLRDDIILNLVNLNVEPILGTTGTTGLVNIPAASPLRVNTDCYTAAFSILKTVLNGALAKISGVAEFIPSSMTTLDSLFTKANLATLVGTLCSNIVNAYNNGLLDVAMPILNFFVGWTTDSQKLVSPQFTFVNSSGTDYDITTGTETISILNNSSGMLLKHGSTYEKPYTMTITNIEFSSGSGSATTGTVAPGQKLAFTYTPGTTNNQTVYMTVTYQYSFKDGTAIGGEQKAISFFYVSSSADEMPGSSHQTAGNCNIDGKTNYVITNLSQLKSTINNMSVSVQNYASTGGSSLSNSAYNSYDTTFISPNTSSINAMTGVDNKATVYCNPAIYNDAADTSTLVSGGSFALGNYVIKAKWGLSSGTKTTALGNLYYANLTEIQNYYKSVTNSGYQRSQFKTDAATDTLWNTYISEMQNTCKMLYKPTVASSFATDYSQTAIDGQLKALTDAVTALKAATASSSDYSVLSDAVTAAEGTNGVDYQNYDLFTFFDYQDAVKNANNMISAYQAPVAPDKYIDGSSLSEAEINTVIAGASSYASAITATVKDPSQTDLDSYTTALAAFKLPTYSTLELDDAAAKVGYYKGLLQSKAANLTMLTREIACAEAQGYVEANYTATSWAKYAKALADAKAITSTSLASEAFSAKYGLMIAEKNLMLKDNSAIENGTYTELNALIAQAKSIFTDSSAYTYDASKGTDTTLTETEARAKLIATLGYEYTDAKTNETVNLYGGSVEAYVANDRFYSPVTTAYTDKVLSNLKVAMAPFVSKYTAVTTSQGTTEGVTVDNSSVSLITGVTPGTINSAADVLARVTAKDTTNTTLTAVANNAGLYGTGATAVLALATGSKSPIATYTVVIFGDVNGDGAVDAFDASVMDLVISDKAALVGAYKTAGGLATGKIDLANYGLVVDAAFGGTAIAQ